MIHTLTVSPALDVTCQVDLLKYDDTLRATRVITSAGGKGLNVSRVAVRLGHPSVALGYNAGFTGQHIQAHLEREGVRTWFTKVDGESRINPIVQAADGHVVRVSTPGPAITAYDIERLVSKMFDLRAPDWLALGGSYVEGCPRGFYADLVRRCRGEAVPVAVDADGDELALAIEAGPDLIKPNRYELERVIGRRVADLRDAVQASQALVRRGINYVATSLGGEGLILVGPEFTVHARPPRVEVESTVGAGDSLLAALLIKLIERARPAEAAAYAVAAGTATAMTPGVALAGAKEIEALLPRVEVSEL